MMSIAPPLANDKPRVLVLDKNRLRQAGVMHLIDEWADGVGLQVTAAAPDVLKQDAAASPRCKMVVVSVGSASVGDDPQRSLIEQIRSDFPEASVVVLSDREEAEEICAAFLEGASGFMPTSIDPAVAFQALTFINAGGTFFPPSTLLSLAARVRSGNLQAPGNTNCSSVLTNKQSAVLNLLRQGEPNKTIARTLGMSDSTVKVHVRGIMRKFGVTNRTQLAVAALESNGLADNPSGQPTTYNSHYHKSSTSASKC
jgi:DNA-binding NarL/FixJ family response regulator